ncbi:MAG: thermonuclease family protein, partial [Alphaproteobacteria bacterium]
MRAVLFLAIFLLLPIWANAAAGNLPPTLSDGGTATVTAIVDGDTIVLDDDRQVRLVGIQAPKLPLGRPDFQPWPLAD